MKGKARVRRMLPLAVTLIGVMGLLVRVPAPVVGQTNLPQSAQQSAELEEAKRLSEQAAQIYNQGQYTAAMSLAERALAIREKVLGPEHPAVAQSLNNLALLYREQRKYSQAEPLFQRALAIYEKVLGLEHLNVAGSLKDLAGLYDTQGKYSQAEPLFQRSLAIREKVLGKEHPDVATILNNLAALYREMGKYSQVEPLVQRSDVHNGEGVYGLRRAFAIAGAESQLMSLWAVNDYRTNQLMVNYYQRLKNNVGRSDALRQTQLEMLQKPESQHPYYWAAFIPSGDWTAMGSQ